MGKEEDLLSSWRELTPEKQQKVLEYVETLKSESTSTVSEPEYIPKTPKRQKTVGNTPRSNSFRNEITQRN